MTTMVRHAAVRPAGVRPAGVRYAGVRYARLSLLLGACVGLCGCLGFPVITVHALVPPGSFALGERFVTWGGDGDRFEVRPYDGVFRSLYFVVDDRDIELYDVVVVYADGRRERYDGPMVFREGERSRTFALHEGPRRIRSVEFRYHTRGRWADQRARVVVYGVR